MKTYPYQIALLVALLGIALSSSGDATIRSSPGGEIRAVVEDDEIRSAPGGVSLLKIDGDYIRDVPTDRRVARFDGDTLRDATGESVRIYLDGNDVRPAPGGPRLLYIDGDHFRDKPDGATMLFVDGKLNRKQLFAVLYLYLTGERRSATIVHAPPADQPGATMAGTYHVARLVVPDGMRPYNATLTVDPSGNAFAVEMKYENGTTISGVGTQLAPDKLAVAMAKGPVTLSLYKIDGRELSQRTVTRGDREVVASADAVKLVGPDILQGEYVVQQTPGSVIDSTTGTTKLLLERTSTGVEPAPVAFKVSSISPEGKVLTKGVGLRVADTLLAATTPQDGASNVRVAVYTLSTGDLVGVWVDEANPHTGEEVLRKQPESAAIDP